MKLLPGNAEEYERRHREIWPELVALLKEAGISNYSIFLNKNTNELFACLESGKDSERQAYRFLLKWLSGLACSLWGYSQQAVSNKEVI